ncbi:MAG: rubrerythrin [Bacillota bacterium]
MLGEKTKKNLEDALAGESVARNKYEYFASVARKAGFMQIANIFEESARNEKEHAKLWARQLELISENTEKNLADAVKGETYEHTEMYQRMADEASAEGHQKIALMFRNVAKAEAAHAERFEKILDNFESSQIFSKDTQQRWKCDNCGYIHEGTEAPDKCPACQHPQAYFEIFNETY